MDITSGKFVFSTSEAYLIEKGKITKPVKGATLIGSGIEVMQKISMVADKSELDLGIGVCGKEGQSVPVGVGQPALKLMKVLLVEQIKSLCKKSQNSIRIGFYWQFYSNFDSRCEILFLLII